MLRLLIFVLFSLIMCLSFIDHHAVFFRISEEEYVASIKEEIRKVVVLQEELDIDVLVHGEPEVSSHLIMSKCYSTTFFFL